MNKYIPTDIIIMLPPINPDDYKCTCGADDNGWVSFWFHKPECRRYISIAKGFDGTVFEHKYLHDKDIK